MPDVGESVSVKSSLQIWLAAPKRERHIDIVDEECGWVDEAGAWFLPG